MTEAEWQACDDDTPRMLAVLKRGASKRRLRLFAIACCRQVWPLITDERCRKAIESAELAADGLISKRELDLISAGAEEAFEDALTDQDDGMPKRVALAHAASYTSNPDFQADDLDAVMALAPGESSLLRDIFGNPFRPVIFSPEWRTDTAVALASQMYESCDFSAMPILADALQDAGCDNDDILNHCRSGGVHVRGCWVADLVLGRG